jgi:hypothetical protein
MKRWPLIRHIRWGYALWQMACWYALWSAVGEVGPAQSDLDILDAIWRGEG